MSESGEERIIAPKKTVCGRTMTADLEWYPQSEYHQEKIYFCTEFCLDAYKADPERFLLAHKEKRTDVNSASIPRESA